MGEGENISPRPCTHKIEHATVHVEKHEKPSTSEQEIQHSKHKHSQKRAKGHS